MSMRRSMVLLAAAAAAVAVTGCTPQAPPTEGGASGSPSPWPTDAEQIIETRTVTTDGGQVEVGLHPLVRVGDHVVLTVDLVAEELPSGEEWLSGVVFDLDAAPGAYTPGGAFRLIDAEALRVHLPALGADGEPVGTSGGSYTIDADGMRLQQVYAAPEQGAAVGLLMPGDYVDELPVIDGAPPAPTLTPDDAVEPVEVGDAVQAPVLPLESLTRQLDGAVQVIESTEEVRIDLSGDVLFAFGSAELGPDADAVLDAAERTLEARGSGAVDIVGHTDDVGDEGANQTLSEQRAQAVAAALSERVDAAAFELRASGRGESEPFVANDTEANRQLNRRVTLTLATQEVTRAEIPDTGELPPFEDGPVATGAEGVELATDAAGEFRISAPAARRVGGLLVVVVEATRTDDGAYEVGWALNLAASAWSYRGEGTVMDQWPFSPRLLVGSTAVYPMDYAIGAALDGDVHWRIAGDNDAQRGAGGGQTLRFVALYPDVDGADAIAIENLGAEWSSSYRLTAIPVE